MKNNTKDKIKWKAILKKNSAKEVGIITIAGGGQDIVSNNVTNGTPSENINNVKPHRIIRLENSYKLLSPDISSFEVRLSVLLRQALLGHILSLEVEKDEPA